MDGKRNQGQDDRPQQALGPLDFWAPDRKARLEQWLQERAEEMQREQQQHQQQQLRSQQQAAMNGTAPSNPVNQGFGNPGHGLGPQPEAFTIVVPANGQPPSFLPTMLPGNQPGYYSNAVAPPVPLAPGAVGPSYQPRPQQWISNGTGVPNAPNAPQQGQQAMFPMPMGNEGNWPGAGAVRHQGQAVQAPGNLQPRNQAPRNAASNTPANIQQPAGEQPALKRPADGEPLGNQPALKRHAGGGAAGEGRAGEQPNNSSHSAAAPANPAPMSISERLDRGLITDVAGLAQQETGELLLWARRKGMKWKDIRQQFKFKAAESTLRGWHRNLQKQRLPRVPEFTERDEELVLEAVEHIAGGRLDDVDNAKIPRLWLGVQEYIKEHGGATEAGPKTLKKKYKELTQNMPGTHEDLKPSKAKGGDKVQVKKEASLEDDVKQDEPAGESDTRDDGASGEELDELKWDHSEYEKYEVEYEEGADFGETDDDEEEDDDDDEDPVM